jgi:hypothetical protein
MKLDKKVTDFITLDRGSIGHKSAVVTGALLASSVLGLVLTSEVEAAYCYASHYGDTHYETYQHTNTHTDGPFC